MAALGTSCVTHFSKKRQVWHTVDLLIGYNWPQALMRREVVCGQGNNQFFAQTRDLSYDNQSEHYCDTIGVSHCIIVKQVIPQPKPPIQVTFTLFLKPRLREWSLLKMSWRFWNPISVNKQKMQHSPWKIFYFWWSYDTRQMDILKCPFHLKKKGQGCLTICPVLSSIWHVWEKESRRIRNIAPVKLTLWKISSVLVMQRRPQKSKSTIVQLGTCCLCSVQFWEISLNDHLLTGPELTNTLLRVLCRFCKGQIAIMCHVEWVLHRFHVKSEDIDYLRFLLGGKRQLWVSASIFRKKAHLFGTASLVRILVSSI